MIERPIRFLANALTFIAGIGLMLMMLQTMADVVMANFFGRPIRGNLEIVSVYHMVLVVFLPLAFVELRHEHIVVDLMAQLLPKPVLRVCLVFGYLVCAVFFGILAYQTWLDALNAWRVNEIMMGAVYVTIWPAKFALPVGFAAIFLAVLLHAWKALVDPDFDPRPGSPEDIKPIA
ncbi:TRAP transporter small permease [Aureimonas fodinaquatilis]|uniref:TRAP transporter small permease protein n=1 Tax=Aureimonas fodinaquatilis TaxID=2565783 RepID=A0A5B0E125_9HYPH|nr:TRAP transporter small permease subunit [Aureimonas fodinaquatilis]KAA0972002.1 TRAP transporter small permease [Aureimonas fodinaquatilis]